MAGAADMLEQMPGHVLLTTGSKELHHFARPGLAERCYPRVLPMADSLERCLTLGSFPKNIICMQGPFSRELNVALLRQYHIQTLVTKDTGGYGGFREKAEAARGGGCALLVVEPPPPGDRPDPRRKVREEAYGGGRTHGRSILIGVGMGQPGPP